MKQFSFLIMIYFTILGPQAHAEIPGSGNVGQAIIAGFYGNDENAHGFINTVRNLEEGKIGGVVFLPQNIKDAASLKRMTSIIKKCQCKYKPLIAVDEEGGKIQRLGSRISEGYLPSASEMVNFSEAQRTIVFEKIANRVKAYGFNLNFAPVVDLNVDPKNPVIGGLGRSYSRNPDTVIELAEQFIRAHHKNGLLTSLKHFPGHGSSREDSHQTIADASRLWSEEELKPYQELINRGLVDVVMVGHIYSPRWNGVATDKRASAISTTLRLELGYDGVIVTDDMFMGAVRNKNRTSLEAAVSGLATGADMVILGRTENLSADVGSQLYFRILQALQSGELNKSQIEKSIQRVLNLKKRL